jgi:flagellar P-ring protein precursor FlgI
MKFKTVILLIILASALQAQRLKDIAYFNGSSDQQVIGYGLVVGLASSGDTYRSSFTVQSVTSMLKRFGITVPQTDLRTRNVAAVMVTAKLSSYLKAGSLFDVTVSSMGDATSLQGGTLLMTPMSAMDGKTYGYAQGSLSVGGYDISTPSGNRVAKNHSLAGRVPAGGRLEVPVTVNEIDPAEVSVFLKNPDFTTSNNIVNAINTKFGNPIAVSVDAGEVKVAVPQDKQKQLTAFLAEMETIAVQCDVIAKVVLNERTGTVVAGSSVKIQPVTISHGNLNISVRSYPVISQPSPLSNGKTVMFNNQVPYAQQDSSKTIAITGASTVQEVAAALNSLKVQPRDIIGIFQALKEAGALIAELVII